MAERGALGGSRRRLEIRRKQETQTQLQVV